VKSRAVKSVCFKPVSVTLAVIVLCLSNVWSLDAVPSAAQHEMSGTVQQVGRETITIVADGGSELEVYTWDKDTKFVRNGVFTTVDALHPGVHVTIRCSHPIFGSPRLYRVIWQTSSNLKGK
jgi:hypothetical protein